MRPTELWCQWAKPIQAFERCLGTRSTGENLHTYTRLTIEQTKSEARMEMQKRTKPCMGEFIYEMRSMIRWTLLDIYYHNRPCNHGIPMFGQHQTSTERIDPKHIPDMAPWNLDGKRSTGDLYRAHVKDRRNPQAEY